MVEGVRVVPDGASVETLITRVDLTREAIVPGGTAPRRAMEGFAAAAHISGRSTNGLTVEATANRPGLLVVLEAYRGGWTATLDGQPVPLLRANAIFRGVLIPAGHHRIEMAYRPRAWTWALAAGAVGLAGLCALASCAVRSRPERHEILVS